MAIWGRNAISRVDWLLDNRMASFRNLRVLFRVEITLKRDVNRDWFEICMSGYPRQAQLNRVAC